MGRRGFGGILSAIARDAARAQRQAEASRKRQLQAQARQVRESLRGARQLHIAIEREARQQERAERQQYLEDRIAETEDRNEDLQSRIEELRNILAHTLSVNDTVHFDDLRIKEPKPVFSPPSELLIPKAIPQKRALLSAVQVLGKVSQLLPWVKSRYWRALAAAEAQYGEMLQDYREEESQRQNRLASLRANYERTKQVFEQKVKQRDLEVDELEAAYRAGNPDAIVTYNTMVLERSEYPEGFPQEFQVAYVPESKQLVIEYELPTPEVVPAIAECRYVKARDDVEEKPRKPTEIKDLYQDIVAAVSLRTLHEVFEADQSNHLIVVVFNGLVQAIDPATGREIRPYLISARATKDNFLELNLARVDTRTCLRNLGAQVSPQPTELVAVKPIVDFNMADKHFI